jgi:outer membrane protein assembly factor BamB
MSAPTFLTDDAIRSALGVDPQIVAPPGLGDVIRAGIDVTPQRRGLSSLSLSRPTRVGRRLVLLGALLAALLGTLVLVGQPRDRSTDIPTYGGGPSRDHVMPGPAPQGTPVLEWEVPSGPTGSWSPVVAKGVIYNADGRGIVAALDAASGAQIWEAEVGAPVSSSVSVDDGSLLVGDVDGFLHVLDAADGTQRVTYDAAERIQAPPAVMDGVAYFGTPDGRLHAVDVDTGRSVWPAPIETSGAVTRGVAAADGQVFVASDGQTRADAASLSAYAAATGEALWTTPLQPGAATTPSYADGLVLVTGGLGADEGAPKLFAVDARTGAPAWPAPFTSPSGTDLYIVGIADGRMYVHSADGHVHAVSTVDGTLVWTALTAPGESPNGGLVDGVLYLTGAGSDVVAIDAEGRERWRVTLEQGSARAPAIVGGRIIMATDRGMIVSLADAAS